MGRTHSLQTRLKISQGVRAAHARKRLENSPTAQAKQKAAENFAKGHPDGVSPSAVRNYGDFGPDMAPSLRPLSERDNSKVEEHLSRTESRPPESR